jgi:serine/threonine protein kinase
MKTFDHPNIVPIFDWFEDKERIYIIMELMEGGDLHDRIVAKKNSRFEEEEIASII